MSEALRHLAVHLERVVLLVQQHMRVYGQRLVDGRGAYSDKVVGRGEIAQLFGQDVGGPDALAFLDELGVPRLAAIRHALAQVEDRIAGLEARAAGPLPLVTLARRFGLDDIERDLLVVAAAPLLNASVARLYQVAWADFTQKQATTSFLVELVGLVDDRSLDEVMARLQDQRVLVAERLIERHANPAWRGEARLHAFIGVPERVLLAMRGEETGLVPAGATHHVAATPVEALLAEPGIVAAAREALALPRPRLVLQGPPGVGRRTLVAALVAASGRSVLEVSLAQGLTPPAYGHDARLAPQLAEVQREALLRDAVLLLRADAEDQSELVKTMEREKNALRGRVAAFPGAVVVTTSETTRLAKLLLGADHQVLRMSLPDRAGQRGAWRALLSEHLAGADAERVAEAMSRGYQVAPGGMARAVQGALAAGARRGLPREEALSEATLTAGVRRQMDHKLGWLAQPMTVGMGLEDVVVTAEGREKIDEILAFARHADRVFKGWGFSERTHAGQGLSVLFSGPPGTGKTLLAGVLARELGRVIYRVDLSSIVDKYIGETEKNLSRVFDEAERAQAVLLFDEADSLFAKRTSVSTSNDRYANLEVNYLLQRLDAYDGVSVLTTNLESSIDEAFMRRIRFKVKFPKPEPEERIRLWQTLLPPRAPVADDVDWEDLGYLYELSGGHIRNAVLRASIAAASRGSVITEDDLRRAARAECAEIGILVRG